MFIESRALTFQKNSFKNDEKMFFFWTHGFSRKGPINSASSFRSSVRP